MENLNNTRKPHLSRGSSPANTLKHKADTGMMDRPYVFPVNKNEELRNPLLHMQARCFASRFEDECREKTRQSCLETVTLMEDELQTYVDEQLKTCGRNQEVVCDAYKLLAKIAIHAISHGEQASLLNKCGKWALVIVPTK